MCINESKEFEAINQKTCERKVVAETEGMCKEAISKVTKKKATKKAIVLMVVILLALVATSFGIVALERIGWINRTFSIVLMCLAGAKAMFDTGYLWHEIKN